MESDPIVLRRWQANPVILNMDHQLPIRFDFDPTISCMSMADDIIHRFLNDAVLRYTATSTAADSADNCAGL